MKKTKVLLVEDDQYLGERQRDFLIHQGLDVNWLQNGRYVEAEVDHFQPDVIVLELILPSISGLDVCRKIRDKFSGSILFVTASDDDIDHVACLELGADDFVVKPIRPRVLLARIRMLMRSRKPTTDKVAAPAKDADTLDYSNLVLKSKTREVTYCGEQIKLTDSEFHLLWVLASHPDEIMERSALYKILRGVDFDGVDRSVDTRIASLRKKLCDTDAIPGKIITVRSRGYLFCSDSWR